MKLKDIEFIHGDKENRLVILKLLMKSQKKMKQMIKELSTEESKHYFELIQDTYHLSPSAYLRESLEENYGKNNTYEILKTAITKRIQANIFFCEQQLLCVENYIGQDNDFVINNFKEHIERAKVLLDRLDHDSDVINGIGYISTMVTFTILNIYQSTYTPINNLNICDVPQYIRDSRNSSENTNFRQWLIGYWEREIERTQLEINHYLDMNNRWYGRPLTLKDVNKTNEYLRSREQDLGI
jgi:hypothetical protein